jgi:CRP-like cAMP-binding protein
MSVLDDRPVSATVSARDAVQTLFLARSLFHRLVAEQPGLAQDLQALAETRKLENLLTFQPEPGDRDELPTGEQEIFL